MFLRFAFRLSLTVSSLLALGSCSSDGFNGAQVNPDCTSGQSRCVGNAFQQCGGDGTFQTMLNCSQSAVCSDTLGCVACLPNTTTCDSSAAEVHSCNADGSVGALKMTCPFGQACSSGACIDSCELAASEYVYLVDVKNNFLSYEPRYDTNPASLKLIGKLNCSASATPFSMGVDRKARAWVLYSDGNIYFVSPADASCTPSGYMPNQGGFNTFGMGFASDAIGSKTESLYVGNFQGGTHGLAKVDPGTMLLAKFADFPASVMSSPEMSGTGDAKLYAYFPSATVNQHFISQVNKMTGAFDVTWQLPPLPSAPQDWAFAHWGGRYYQFVTSGKVSQIRRYDPATQQNVIVLDNTAYPIVGAGVSTCAPYVSG